MQEGRYFFGRRIATEQKRVDAKLSIRRCSPRVNQAFCGTLAHSHLRIAVSGTRYKHIHIHRKILHAPSLFGTE